MLKPPPKPFVGTPNARPRDPSPKSVRRADGKPGIKPGMKSPSKPPLKSSYPPRSGKPRGGPVRGPGVSQGGTPRGPMSRDFPPRDGQRDGHRDGPRAAPRDFTPRKPAPPRATPPAATTDWSGVAEWYDRLVGDDGSEYHQKVVFPGVMRLLQVEPADAVLDVACGQGALCRLLEAKGATVTGIDAAEPLIAAARTRGPNCINYYVGDARELEQMPAIAAGTYASAACVLAIQNMHPIAPVLAGVARALRPMGRFVLAMMHPCFRGPKETSWGWDGGVQFRRVDRYLVPRKTPIVTHPGSAPDVYTWTFHKPIEAYVRALRGAGLLVDAIEEWPSHKTSEPGPRAAAENQARSEIPMFMAIRALKIG